MTLFPLKVAQENRVFAGVRIVVRGVRWGPPWAQVVDIGPLASIEVGLDEKIIFMQIRGKYYLTLSMQQNLNSCILGRRHSFLVL